MLLGKNERSLDFFSSDSKSSKEKESLQDKDSDTKFSFQMLPRVSCKVGSFYFTDKSNVIVTHLISQYPFKLFDHRTCGIGDITFFICHETAYNHVIKESCDFVCGGPMP